MGKCLEGVDPCSWLLDSASRRGEVPGVFYVFLGRREAFGVC